MSLEFTSRLNASLLRLHVCRRLLPWVLLCLSAISLSLLGAFLQESWDEPVAVVGLTFASVLVLVLVGKIWRSFTNVNRMVSALGSSPIHYRLDEACLRVTDCVGAVELPWDSFVSLEELPRRIVLRVHSGGAIMLFSDDIPAEAMTWIRIRIPVAPMEQNTDADQSED